MFYLLNEVIVKEFLGVRGGGLGVICDAEHGANIVLGKSRTWGNPREACAASGTPGPRYFRSSLVSKITSSPLFMLTAKNAPSNEESPGD